MTIAYSVAHNGWNLSRQSEIVWFCFDKSRTNLVCQIIVHISYQIKDLNFFDKSKQKLLAMAFLKENQNCWTDWLDFCYCVGSSYWKTRTTILRRRFSPLSMYKMLHTRKLLQTACRLYGEYTLPQFRIRFQGFRFHREFDIV